MRSSLSPEDPQAAEAAPQPLELACPRCGGSVTVSQVQGDRCPACGVELKRFGPSERETARDYFRVLTGRRHYVELPEGEFVVAHD